MESFDIDKYDRAVEKMAKSDYPIPKDFDRRVEMTIKNMRAPNRLLKYPIAAAVFIILIFLTVNLIPSVAIQASYIPGLNVVIDWLTINKGEKKALEKGYPVIGPVTVQKKGYALQLEDIFIDDVTIRLSAKLTGKGLPQSRIPASEQKRMMTEQTEIQEMTNSDRKSSSQPEKEQHTVISFHLYSNDFNLTQTASSCSSKNEEVIAQEIQIYFDDYTTLEDFLKSNPEYLSFNVKICRDDYLDCTIEDIRVPIEKESILLSRHYDPSKTIDLDHTAVSFKRFQVSPTRMVVEAHYSPKDGYYIMQWDKKWLKDSEGNIYDASGESGRSRISDIKSELPILRMDIMYHYFIPSLYFEDEMPEKLFFCYDGYRIGSFKGTDFILNINDTYPKTVKFLGEDITVEDFKYHNNNTLALIMKLPEFDVISNDDVISPDIIFVDSTRRSVDMLVDDIKGEISKRYTLYIKGLPRKDSYKIDLWGAGYHIDASGEIELDLNE